MAMFTYPSQSVRFGTPNGAAKLPEWKAWSNEDNGAKTMNPNDSSAPGSTELKLFMTQLEHTQENLIRETETSKDEIVQKFTRLVAKRTLVKLNCEAPTND